MPSLHARLQDDLKSALKAGEKTKTDVLRFLLAQIHNREIEKRSQGKDLPLTEEEVLEVLSKEAKKRKEAIGLFKKGNRRDLVQKEETEIVIVSNYLPEELPRETIEKEVEEIIASGQVQKDFGSVMKEAMKKMKGRVESRMVSEIIKEKLGSSGE
ncbi:MAG: GatB/YqeY domain-containing protein [Candidatus Liptonbacteria bacterium]|nr:GatB/YqeY domain-containing protein [Candidatus Liptonbacteria bacterium]